MRKWDESKHPRHPAGAPNSQGGEFAPKVGSAVAWKAKDTGFTKIGKITEFGRTAGGARTAQVLTSSGETFTVRVSSMRAPLSSYQSTNKRWPVLSNLAGQRPMSLGEASKAGMTKVLRGTPEAIKKFGKRKGG